MDDLKFITASNIINLRTQAGMTQTELGNLLSYSDKSVSKWERAEAVPDAYVLKKLSEIFGVTVDDLLSSHCEWKPVEEDARSYNSRVITTIALVGIWTAALTVFIVFWMLGRIVWLAFVAALPTSLITLLVLNSLWEKGRHNEWIVGALVLSLLATAYFCFAQYRPWQIFLLAAPAELIVWLAFRVRRKPQNP